LRRRGRVSFIPSEFLIRRNVRGYTLPTRCSYMLHECGAYSGLFRLPAVGCTAIMKAPIDWGSVEALPAPSERCEAAVPSYERQVASAIPQCTAHGHGTPLLSQLLQQEPGPPGPYPLSSSSSDSDEGGPPGTGLLYEGEWWWYTHRLVVYSQSTDCYSIA